MRITLIRCFALGKIIRPILAYDRLLETVRLEPKMMSSRRRNSGKPKLQSQSFNPKASIVVVVVVRVRRVARRQTFYLSVNFRASLLGKLHNQRQVFAGAAGRRLIALLAKHHIFGGEPAYFDKQLSGGAALSAAVKQTAVAARPAFWRAGRRAKVFFAAVFARTPVIFLPTFVRSKVESLIISHLRIS
jgi:hypothetical protein